MAPVNLNDVVARVISLTRPKWRDMALANGIDIQLITQLADDLPEISGDEAELRSALGNLVFNAVDAMSERWHDNSENLPRWSRSDSGGSRHRYWDER